LESGTTITIATSPCFSVTGGAAAATPGVAATATRESIYKRKRFSDHAPLTIDYEYPL
jgi:hypothetical protein